MEHAIRDMLGHWAYVIDDEAEHRESFTDKSRLPDFTPAGHWEWIPSPTEVYKAMGYGMMRFYEVPRPEPKINDAVKVKLKPKLRSAHIEQELRNVVRSVVTRHLKP